MKTPSQLSSEAMANYRQAFQRRTRQLFEAREKRRQQAKQAACDAIETVIFCYPSVQRVYLFGSVINPGAFRDDSDIDIGVEGADMALCFDIWRDLEQKARGWMFDVRPLESSDTFSERVRQKGELVYEQSVTTP